MNSSTEHPDSIAKPLQERILADAEPSALLDQAANIAIRFTAAPRDYLGPATDAMKTRAALGEKIAAAIRALHDSASPAVAPEVAADEREALEDERNAAYPVPDSPHTSGNLRAVAERTGFTRGRKARAAFAAAPVQPVAVPDGELARIFQESQDARDKWFDAKLHSPSLIASRAKFIREVLSRAAPAAQGEAISQQQIAEIIDGYTDQGTKETAIDDAAEAILDAIAAKAEKP